MSTEPSALKKDFIFLNIQKHLDESGNPTCNVDINGGEGCERHRGNVLRSNSQMEKRRGFVIQRLGHQDGRGAVFTVRGEVEPDRHVGFGHHPVLQVVGHPGVTQLGGGFEGLEWRRKTRHEECSRNVFTKSGHVRLWVCPWPCFRGSRRCSSPAPTAEAGSWRWWWWPPAPQTCFCFRRRWPRCPGWCRTSADALAA